MFLDHRWVLFSGIRRDSNRATDGTYHPYLEIIDPIDNSGSTILELDKPVFTRISENPTVHIRLSNGGGHEKGFVAENEDMPFVLDASRGIISAEVCWQSPDAQHFELHVFVLEIESVLSKVPSPPGLERRYIEWKDISPSTAVFSYDSRLAGQSAILSRYSYVAGFRYVSPTQLLYPNNPMSPRCFFVYDFNPLREAPDPLAGTTPEDSNSEMGYQRSASEVTRDVVGGLSCWRMRFDLPVAEADLDRCQVALMDGGPVLFEVGHLTILSERSDSDIRSLKVERVGS